ncbi:MAG: hypothetical protein ACYSU4_05905 [Planctomycetota bacterium]
MDFRSYVMKKLPDIVDGVGYDLAAGMPGCVAELRADLIDPTLMSIQSDAGKGGAAHADEDLVRPVVYEAMAVDTAVHERLGVEHVCFFEVLEVPLADAHTLACIRGGCHASVNQIGIDFLLRNVVDDGLVATPNPIFLLHADVEV